MTDQIRVYAGECTAAYEGTVNRTARGHVLALVKPDDTVLIHDRAGYSPVAWLTRSASIDIDCDDRPQITAVDGDQRLTVRFHGLEKRAVFPISVAGVPVGRADASGMGPYVRCRGSVVNITNGDRYALPSETVLLDRSCNACGLPLVRADRTTTRDRPQCLDSDCERPG